MKSTIVITCAKESTGILKEELSRHGFKVEKENRFDVTVSGTFDDCLYLNMHIRTAHRVLWLIKSFQAPNPDILYDEVKKINWDDYLYHDGYISITSYVVNDFIKDTRFANLKVKDAIADLMVSKYKQRPDSGSDRDQAVIFLHWVNDNAAIYLDTSGETIAKHNYRKFPYKAPLLESLASAIIYKTGWTPDQHFINPMCGSGTLAIEAALIGLDIAPGLSRKNFAFMHYKIFDKNIWEKLKIAAHKRIKDEIKGKIIASDFSKQALQATQSNARIAEVLDMIKIELCDFAKTSIPEGNGIIVFNPPYGERIGEAQDLKALYNSIGDFFKQKCGGKTGYIFTGNSALGKQVGLRTKSKTPFYTAKIECRLLEYELYSGTRKSQ